MFVTCNARLAMKIKSGLCRDSTLPLTRNALLGLHFVFTTTPFAVAADNVLLACEFCSLALVQILKSHTRCMLHIWPLSRSLWSRSAAETRRSPASHAKHVGENVVHIRTCTSSGTTTPIESGHAMCVVEVSFLIIVKDFVGFANGFEFDVRCSSFTLLNFVWVA